MAHGARLDDAAPREKERGAAGPGAPVGGDVRLLDAPFSEEAATAALRDAGGGRIGAIVAFTGIVRADDGAGGPVTALGFEAYPEMALAEMEAVRAEALDRYEVEGLTIWHRADTLDVGDPIVLVAAAARHRDTAFAAAAWTMDEVKRRVPLWKRETRADGSTTWVHADSCTCGHGRDRPDASR